MADLTGNYNEKELLFDSELFIKTEMCDGRDAYSVSELEPIDGELIKDNITDLSELSLKIVQDRIQQDSKIESDDSTPRETSIDDTAETRELCHFSVPKASLKTELDYSMLSESDVGSGQCYRIQPKLSVGTEPGYSIQPETSIGIDTEPCYSIQPESSVAYIIQPVSLVPYTDLGNDSCVAGVSVKVEPTDNMQSYYVAGIEQGEGTLHESIVAKPVKNEPYENTHRKISIVNLDPGEVILNDSIVADLYPSIRNQPDESTYVDIGPREETLSVCLVAEPSIKIETDMNDSLLGQHSESHLGPGKEIQETYDESSEFVNSIKTETDLNDSSDSTHTQDSGAYIEPEEKCLEECAEAGTSVKIEPEGFKPEETSIAKQPVTRCVTLILPDNAKLGLNSSPVIPVQKHHMCNICGKWFSKDRTLQRHQQLYHNKPHCRNVNSLTCDVCSKAFSEKEDLILHIKTHEDKDMQRRKKDKDMQRKKNSNYLNKTEFKRKTKNASHRKSKRSKCGKKIHACDFCDKIFNTAVAVRQHLQVHSSDKPYQCPDCGKSFKRQSHLQTHSTIHSGERPYKCGLCDWSFTDQSGLRRHQVIHTGEKPFKCDVCGKKFSRIETLQKHSVTHMEKQFNCDTCGKSFNRLVTLQKHIIKHSQDNPFQCDVCGKGFSDRRGVRRHSLIHTGDAQFKCVLCSRAFLHSYHLSRHMKTHKKDKARPHECDHCGQRFVNKADAKRHAKKAHTK